jgi:hypothetical protein
MQVVIQAVEQRRRFVENIQSKLLGAIASYDNSGTPIEGFSKTLDIPIDTDYRLHVQDDIIIANGLYDYLPKLEEEMRVNNMKCLALYVPNQKKLHEAHSQGKQYETTDRVWIQGIIFHKDIVEALRLDIKTTKEVKHDDVFVRDVLKKLKIKAYVHLPGLVQHNVWLGSVVGHAKTSQRMSTVFDINFIKKV